MGVGAMGYWQAGQAPSCSREVPLRTGSVLPEPGTADSQGVILTSIRKMSKHQVLLTKTDIYFGT